jgi:hypothetical protein
MMEDKETIINNIIKSNKNLDSEFFLIPIKLSIFMITNLLYYVTKSGYNENSKLSILVSIKVIFNLFIYTSIK